jgi:hypothetical protein
MVSWCVFHSNFFRVSGYLKHSSRCHVMDSRRRGLLFLYFYYIPSRLPLALFQPTGTSTKFVNMTERALLHFEDEHSVKFEKITKIPLEGVGTADRRVERYAPSIASQH